MTENLFSESHQLLLVLSTLLIKGKDQAKFDEIVQYIWSVYQSLGGLIEFSHGIRNIVILSTLVGMVIFVVILVSKLSKTRTILWSMDHVSLGHFMLAFCVVIFIIGVVISADKYRVRILYPEIPSNLSKEQPEIEISLRPRPLPKRVEAKPVHDPKSDLISFTPPRSAPEPTESPAASLNIPGIIRLAKILHDDGEYVKAIECYKKVLEIDPGNRDALSGIERAKSAGEAEERVRKK